MFGERLRVLANSQQFVQHNFSDNPLLIRRLPTVYISKCVPNPSIQFTNCETGVMHLNFIIQEFAICLKMRN